MNYRNRIARAQRGFTLSEILVTTAIFAIIMLAALTVYDRSNKVFKTSTEAADMQQSTRIAFDKLVADLRMAGFDYNRGGTPSGDGQFPQPDEQIEYAGKTAVVFRANFDYNDSSTSGNGLAPSNYTVNGANGGPIFPYITTDNKEIIGYVLRSTAPNATNGDSISFWTDDYIPRRGYPNVNNVSSGGQPEAKVTISGIDLTNNNPPYTLYRVTLADGNCNGTCTINVGTVGTPVAENIRSINLRYYTDGAGTVPLFNPPDPSNNNAVTAIAKTRNAGTLSIDADLPSCDPATSSTWVDCTGAIGGDGQFDPSNSNTTNVNDRLMRATIQAVRLDLVGMNATPEANYRNPAEGTSTVSVANVPIQSYRSYSLSSLIVPRNLGKTGFPEPSYNPPGPPTVTGMCIGHCGAPVIYWSAPTSGGPVVSYRVVWDVNQNGTFEHGYSVGDPTARSSQIPDDGFVSDFNSLVFYRVLAVNDNGESQPSNSYAVKPQNTTKPDAPTGLAATTNQNNQITLSWAATGTNASGTLTCSGGPTGGAAPTIPYPQEIIKYRIARGTTPNFDADDPNQRTIVLDYTTATPPAPLPAPGGTTLTYVDGPTTSASPPSACVTYYYKIQALDHCSQQANWNVSGNAADGRSAWSAAQSGQATSTSTPAKVPGTPVIFGRGANSYCTSNANCQITIQWQKTVNDTATPTPNPVAVDTYRITRSKRTQGTSAAFQPDATFNTGSVPTGTMEVSGFTQMVTPTFVDKIIAPYNLAYSDANGPIEYQYTIAPKICQQTGVESDPVLWPGCTIGFGVAASGATAGNGAGPGTAWYFTPGDVLGITYPNGTPITSVRYDVYVYGGSHVSGFPVTASAGTASPPTFPNPPYPFSWPLTMQDQTIYQVWVTVTTATCQETRVVYVYQDRQANCQFDNQTPPTTSTGNSSTFSIANARGQNEQAIYNFVIQNNSTERIDVNQTSPSNFVGTMDITWQDPCRNNASCTQRSGNLNVPYDYSDMSIVAVEWDVPSTGCASALTRSTSAATAGPIGTNASLTATYTLPSSTLCNVPANNGGNTTANAKATLKITFQYNGQSKPSLLNNPSALLKICIKHKIPSDPLRTQNCNLVGRGGTSANPGSCD